jgi:predicted oxidoreductase
MKYLKINKKLKVSQLAVGCMRLAAKNGSSNASIGEIEKFVKTALDIGINFFDHADIYGNGKCEEIFGEVLKKHPE